ncbi:DUF6261 family protein [Chryseobacterium sp. Ch-15]|uniref:DUF6261 family protein n=1 Tax=Chryseobacterium muglaense TaxID=2893752 RepID=A0A9Q3URH6_9FLAO|nr:DUF6261 family protein [Chryseobacterium muglaense]MBD3904170.1 hypothetical protein [Chryseobacterium muglaense]MCC9033257.1 DUF6261 family protein [Chryseobacterium muglaense]MCM2553752.1 DUF6261 family protein [Chryseobacterium muglaense]
MKITLSKLSTKDLATLCQRIINSSESGNFPVISNHPLLTEFKTKYADYDEVYTKQIYSGKGVNVAEADKERDNVFRNLKNYLNSYRKMTLLSNYQFAIDVFEIFKAYDLNLDKLSYSSQTAQMKKLIEELETSENIQKLNALLLLPSFNEMKSKHEAFELIFAEQAGANADLRQMKSASAIRRDLEKTLKSFLSLITAMKDIPDWKLLYADSNELVKAAKNSSIKPENNTQLP